VTRQHWKLFLTIWKDHPPVFDKADWLNNVYRREHADELNPAVEAYLSKYTMAEITELLQVYEADSINVIDVGGDAVANADEPGLRSPLADGLALSACDGVPVPVTVLVAGPGLDGEVEEADVLATPGLSPVARLTEQDVATFRDVLDWHPSEATALLTAAALGLRGAVEVRDAGLVVELTDNSPVICGLTLQDTLAVNAVAARVAGTDSLDEAEGVARDACGFSEIDYERRKAVRSSVDRPASRLPLTGPLRASSTPQPPAESTSSPSAESPRPPFSALPPLQTSEPISSLRDPTTWPGPFGLFYRSPPDRPAKRSRPPSVDGHSPESRLGSQAAENSGPDEDHAVLLAHVIPQAIGVRILTGEFGGPSAQMSRVACGSSLHLKDFCRRMVVHADVLGALVGAKALMLRLAQRLAQYRRRTTELTAPLGARVGVSLGPLVVCGLLQTSAGCRGSRAYSSQTQGGTTASRTSISLLIVLSQQLGQTARRVIKRWEKTTGACFSAKSFRDWNLSGLVTFRSHHQVASLSADNPIDLVLSWKCDRSPK